MLRALVVLALALAAGACAGSRTVVPVTMGASASPLPRSAYELVTHEQAVRDGSQQTHQLAFLPADHLIRRDGFDRLLECFHALGTRVDRQANVRAAFGQSLAELEREALAHLASAVR
jgi:hypothetical protein